ncbi:helix-turn-helix transcriptional regulator [Pseudoxanthomonas mexicana]|uniref:helix-turn-helix domain-containing protein n=1 Tax=Pseudoxanthomonas mexicana TaxID=128785 RepID=UPI0028A69A72|nr:helix-turn-helix transcriptional regulator [Pseudoxanthomonas mexicana]
MEAATLPKSLGSAIRRRRQALKLSQEDFADHIDMHRAYYSAIERGERNLTLVTLHKVSLGLGVAPSKLLAESGF